MGREPKLIVACGKKGVGKSYKTNEMMQQYVRGNPATGAPPRRCLILDVNDEYYNIKAIALKDVLRFSVHPIAEIRRVRPFKEDGKKMTLNEIAEALFFILENYSNGLLLIEDASKYLSDSLPNDVIGAICTNRHTSTDILIHYQSLGRIVPKVWQNMNILRFHKNTDSVLKHKNKFEDKFEYLTIAETMINTQYYSGNQRFYLTVDIDEEKIKGAFEKSMYDAAINEYMTKNYSTLISPLLKARGIERGERVHTPQSAVAFVRDRLNIYNGNLKG